MKQLSLSFWVVIFVAATMAVPACGQQTVHTPEQQIAAAVQAAPEAMRAEAKVYGYAPDGSWAVLRAGSNDLICVADDPAESNYHVSCYYSGLEPFMKRGRELRGQGLSRTEVDERRKQEIEAGNLTMPERPMTLYNLTGEADAFDYATNTLQKASPLTVVYVPFQTAATTGMATSPSAAGGPWLMEGGLPWAHIMIGGKPTGEAVE